MSSLAIAVLLVVALTLLGSGTLLWVTVKYYWADRGRPPATGEERKRQYEEELKRRKAQFEYARTHPIKTRSSSFWDNSKQV
jgi:hypothetical protein